ncbi:Basic secretory protease (Fragments) [Linum grandiflorum]
MPTRTQSLLQFALLLAVVLISTSTQTTVAVEFSVTNRAAGTPGGARFDRELGVDYSRQLLSKATKFIWATFRQNNPADRKPVKRVSLFIDDIDGVAYVTNNGEIHASGRWNFNLKTDFEGVIYHELANVWQWNGKGRASANLTEGIADFVRLKANLAPYYWVKPGEGDQWDEGYDVTARFLDYCEGLRSGFVAELNKKMRGGYSDGFFRELTGKSVDQLWRDYKAKYATN